MNWPYAYGFSFLFWAAIFALCWRAISQAVPSAVLFWVGVLMAAAVAAFFSAVNMDWK